VIKRCAKQLDTLDEHARARALLWLVSRHQGLPDASISIRLLERQAREPQRSEP
jgi:hypothetical protein